MMKYILTYIFLILCNSSIAQFSIEAFLSSASEDLDLLANQSQVHFLSENKFNSPWIHRVEFRSRTNNWDISQDDFRLRFSPTNPREVKANKDFYQIQMDALQNEYLITLNNSLFNRYNLLLEYLMLSDLLKIIEKEVITQNDILTIERNQIYTSSLWLDKILDEEERLTRMILRKNDIQYNINRTELEIRSLYPFDGPISIDREAILGIDGVGSFINVIKNASDTTDIFLAFRNQELLLENQRYAVEKSEQRRNIGYLQFEYDRLRGQERDQHMGFQIGLRLPITNPDRPDLNRRMLDIVGEEAEASQENQQLRVERELSIMDLEYSLDQYKQLSQYIEEKISAYTIANFQIKELDDVYALLKVKEANLNLLQTQFEVTEKIYEQFLDWLYLNGRLVQMPLVNYLDKELKEL
ncbi:hypothetical protein ACFLU5_13625 [Bacteroidota bacterium]